MKFETTLEQHYSDKLAHQLEDFRGNALNKLLEQYLLPGNILDVGCGTGASVIYFKRRGYDIQGIDASTKMLELGKKALREHDFSDKLLHHVDDVKTQLQPYNNILLLDVIEHVERDADFLNNILSFLAPKGRLLLTVPAIPYLFGAKDINVGHFRRYSKQSLMELINAAWLNCQSIRYWNFLGFFPTLIKKIVSNTAINEDFRYNDSWHSVFMRRSLNYWFKLVENHLRPPVGLTLIAILERR